MIDLPIEPSKMQERFRTSCMLDSFVSQFTQTLPLPSRMSSTSSPAALTLSSPPSSPNTYRFSSSPAPPSPERPTSLLPAIELDEPSLDPLSGSSKSIRPPPLYEKSLRVRARSPGDGSPPGPRKRARRAFHDPVEGRVSASTSVQISPVAAPIATSRYSEEENIWNEAISMVVDTVNPVIDLSCVPQQPHRKLDVWV